MSVLGVARRIGSFPTVLIMLGLVLSGISACQAISNALDQPSKGGVLSQISASIVVGGR